MSVDPSVSPLGDHSRSEDDWSNLLRPSTASASSASPMGGSSASTARLSTSSSSCTHSTQYESSISTGRDAERANPTTRVANLLTLTELRKAAWSRIYLSGIITGDCTISTTHVPSWKQFDTLMIKRHRYIAVDPRDNRTLGWIACFDPYPHLSSFYHHLDPDSFSHERTGQTAELQIMVAESERNKGVGTFLINSILTSLCDDPHYSTIQASFFPENQACRKLLERCGFQEVSSRKNAVKMLDGPRKTEWRDLVTFEVKLPPLQHSTLPQHQQEHHETASTPATIDMTIDPNALFKRPRLN